jgi:hypothetical protein
VLLQFLDRLWLLSYQYITPTEFLFLLICFVPKDCSLAPIAAGCHAARKAGKWMAKMPEPFAPNLF